MGMLGLAHDGRWRGVDGRELIGQRVSIEHEEDR
jgi:hypothetical protein